MGGGIYVGQGTLAFENSQLLGNTSSQDGGGIFGSGEGDATPISVTVKNSTVSDNTAADWGGGIYVGFFATLTVKNSTLAANGSGEKGGGIALNYGMGTITGSTVSNNTAQDGGSIFVNPGFGFLPGCGNVLSTSLTVKASTLRGNTSSDAGAGIFNDGGTVTITKGILSSNTSGNGGGVYDAASLCTHTLIIGSTLYGNTATAGFGQGGGIFNPASSTLSITNSTVSHNAASGAPSGGGGIYNDGTLTVNGGTLSSNTATVAGGAVLNDTTGMITMKNSTLSDNSASNGGAIFNGCASFSTPGGSLFVDRGTFIHNTDSSSDIYLGIFNSPFCVPVGSVVVTHSTFAP